MGKQKLSVNETVEFAKTIYANKYTSLDLPIYAHCLSTAKMAEKIARKLFQDMRSDVIPRDVDDIIESIVHASILSEAINSGPATFEQIADIANVQIAAMVSILSRDLRLVETKRDLEYRGRLSTSALPAQIVAMGRIICAAQDTQKKLLAGALAIVPQARKILTQLDGDLLCVHAVSRYYTLRLYAHAARNLISDSNQLIKKLKTEARTAKTVAKMTAGVRNRQAAKGSLNTEEDND